MRENPTVPPRVSGPTRFMLTIKCQRMTLKSNRNYKSSNAVVNVKWWGDDKGIELHPLNINSSSKSSGAKAFTWHVNCLKKHLSEYLSDMGQLNITVLDGENAIGIVKVPVAALTRDPVRPINSFFTISSFQGSMQNEASKKPHSKKIGELHVVLELKPVLNSGGKSNFNGELTNVSFSDSTGTQTPKKKKIISKDNKENSKEHSMVEEPRSSPPVQHRNIINAAFDGEANDILDFSKEHSTLEVYSPDANKDDMLRSILSKERETPSKLKESKIPTLTDRKVSESPAKLNSSKELDLIMKKAEKLRESMGHSLGASQSFLKKFSVAEEKLNAEIPISSQKENESFEISNMSSEISFSDDEMLQLDDDAIIQALNDNVIGGDEINIENIDQLDELSDDAIRTKVINMVNDSSERYPNISRNVLDIFSVDQLTSIGRIHSVYLSVEKFQVTDLISGLSYRIEFHVPLKMNTSHIFHTVAKFKKNRFQITNDHPNDVLIDYQDAHAILFDSSGIANWLDGSIFIQVTAERLNAPSPKKKVEWIGNGILDTKAIITSSTLSFIGKVAIWNSDKSSMKKLLGNILLTIKLVSDITPPTLQNQQDVHIKDALVEPESKISCELLSLYLFLNFTVLKSQRLVDFCSRGSVLAYLSIRIPSLPEPIDTPPVIFNDYSTENQRHNSSINLKHSFTIPFMTPQALGKEQSKLIIEVWHVVSSYDTKIEGNVDHVEHGPSLLGIVKLPFAYILALIESPSTMFPLVIPEAEYSVVDPFSGLSVGWLSTTLAIGSLSQVSEIKSSFSAGISDRNRKTNVETGIQTVLENVAALQSVSVNKEALNQLQNEATCKLPIKDMNSSDPSDQAPSSETIISLTIHQVCGLKSLWENFEKSTLAEGILTDRFNSFLQLVFIPETDDILAEGDFDSSLLTDIVYDEFHYVSDTCVEMTIIGLGSEFIKWARTGGAARGEVLCRIDNRSTVSLGYFDVPLLPLLEGQNGIRQKWMGVFSGQHGRKSNSIPSSFVQVSLYFKSGFDLGSLPGTITANSAKHFFKMRLEITEMRFLNDVLSAQSICVTWILPKRKNGELIFEELVSPYWSCDNADLAVAICEIAQIIEFEIESDPFLLDYYESNDLEFKFWSLNTSNTKRLLGIVFLNIDGILPNKSVRGKQDKIIQKRKHDIINPGEDIVYSAQVTIEMSCTRSKRNKEVQNDLTVSLEKELPTMAKSAFDSTPPMVVEDYIIMLKLLKLKSSKLDSSGIFQFSIDWQNRTSSDMESITLFSDKLAPNDKSKKLGATLKLPLSASQKIDRLTLKLLASNSCLGQVVIPIAVLYLGFEDINGWYSIHSISGELLGQLMVDICFSEPLKIIYRKKIRPKQTQAFKFNEKLPVTNNENPDLDTWKWNGSSCLHQSFPIVDSNYTSNNNFLRKSVHQTTLEELDNLQSLIRSIGVSPKSKAMVKNATPKSEFKDFKDVFKLPELFNPPNESHDDSSSSFKPLTIDDLSHNSKPVTNSDPKSNENTNGEIFTHRLSDHGEHIRKDVGLEHEVDLNLVPSVVQIDNHSLNEEIFTHRLSQNREHIRKDVGLDHEVDVNPVPSVVQIDNDPCNGLGNCDEILVFKSRPLFMKKLNTTIRSVDDDGEIFEELARRRLLSSKKKSAPDDNNANKELIPSDIRKDDRLI